uniref:PH domain-containing protein n=1 Tax=Spongospora subterranea TaxID=70186 RepID=A0A0H5RC33_9EUKA|eukprot:CRZ11167.1 hypothetical protein [Spongospora subterranea]
MESEKETSLGTDADPDKDLHYSMAVQEQIPAPDSNEPAVEVFSADEVKGGRTKPKRSAELLAKKEMLTAQSLTFESTKADDERLYRSQSQAFKAIYNRILNSKRTSNDLAHYLTNRCKRLSGLFAEDPTDVTFGEGELGTLRRATICLEQLTKSGQEQFAECQSGVFAQSVKKARDLSQDLQRRSDELRSAADRHNETLLNERTTMLNSWNNYEHAMRDNLLSETEGKTTPTSKDPYLLARKYLHDLSVYRNGQTTYSRAMKKIFEEVHLNDGRRINVIKDILLDYLLAEKSMLVSKLNLLDESLTAVKSIDREQDVNMFLMTAKELCADDRGKIVFDFEPKSEGDMLIVERLRSHVQHKGLLSRQGKIVKSNYKLGHAVLTLAGFLHFFDKREDDSPVFRLSLQGAEVKNTEETEPCSFTLSIPNRSFFSVSSSPDVYVFKAEDPSSLKEWTSMISGCIDRLGSTG